MFVNLIFGWTYTYNSAEIRSDLIPDTSELSRVHVIPIDDVLNSRFICNEVGLFFHFIDQLI
jgi:hypothetical protein